MHLVSFIHFTLFHFSNGLDKFPLLALRLKSIIELKSPRQKIKEKHCDNFDTGLEVKKKTSAVNDRH